MLVYVALQVLNYLVDVPWKDPNGHNFPQTAPLTAAQHLPHAFLEQSFRQDFVVAIALTLVFLGCRDALGLWLLGPHRRRRAERGALRRL